MRCSQVRLILLFFVIVVGFFFTFNSGIHFGEGPQKLSFCCVEQPTGPITLDIKHTGTKVSTEQREHRERQLWIHEVVILVHDPFIDAPTNIHVKQPSKFNLLCGFVGLSAVRTLVWISRSDGLTAGRRGPGEMGGICTQTPQPKHQKNQIRCPYRRVCVPASGVKNGKTFYIRCWIVTKPRFLSNNNTNKDVYMQQ